MKTDYPKIKKSCQDSKNKYAKMDVNANIEDLLPDYFSGNLSDKEILDLEKWVSESEENKRIFDETRTLWMSMDVMNNKNFNAQKAFARFTVRKDASVKRKERIFAFSRWIAASVVVLIGLGLGFFIGHKAVSTDLNFVSVEAPCGSQSKVTLPDGSLVWLNAGSKLIYSRGFGIVDRNVDFNGEGYFEVAKNKKMPFRIKMNDMNVEVLGTKFNVRNYGDDEEARVALLEGKVCVDGISGQKIYLEPNRQVVMDKRTKQMRTADIRSEYVRGWTKGVIFFDEERITDIARELERIYNVKIVVANEISSYRFFGNFIRTEQPIEEVLKLLASTNKLQYEMDGKNITISMR